MSKKDCIGQKPRRTVCVLTEQEAKGAVEVACWRHRHIGRIQADEMRFAGELAYLDQYKTQALESKVKAPDRSPAHITARESELNAMSNIEPRHPAVRAARRKIRIWPTVGDHKAVRVAPRTAVKS